MNNNIKAVYGIGIWNILIQFIELYSLTGSFKTLQGNKVYFINGKFHREDGPAIEYANGDKFWYFKGKLHRVDGPACEYVDGGKCWYLNGKIHREDGPAIEYTDGDKFWYLNGKRLNETQYNRQMKAKI